MDVGPDGSVRGVVAEALVLRGVTLPARAGVHVLPALITVEAREHVVDAVLRVVGRDALRGVAAAVCGSPCFRVKGCVFI